MALVTLQWDPMPVGDDWIEVRILDGGTQIAVATQPATQITIDVPKAVHTFTARSFNGMFESADSNSLTIKVPSPPGHLRK